ncbi:putative zinc finger, CCHC-type containing protein [Tanacetum coccineum]
MNQDFYNSNPSGFDQYQPPQFPDIHQNPQETNKEILQAREDLMEAIQAFLKEYDHIPPNEKYMALLIAEERFESTRKEGDGNSKFYSILEFFSCIADDEARENYVLEILVNMPKSNITTPDLPIEEPDNSLSMGDEHLDTIPETESDEIIKSSIENLVSIPSEFEGIFDDACDAPFMKILYFRSSEILSISNVDGTSSDGDDDFETLEIVIRSLRSSILLSLIRIILYLNSRLLAMIRKRREVAVPLLMLITLFPKLPEFESFHLDPSSPRPPLEPPDVEISLIVETDVPMINNVDELNEDECFNPGGGEINVEVEDSFTFVTRIFLPYLTYPEAPARSTSAPEFVRRENGLVEIKFSSSQPKLDNVFPTRIHMITLTDQEPAQEVKHIWWDVCNCESCLDEAAKIDDDNEDLPKKRKSSQQKLKRRNEKSDPIVGLLGEPSGKFDYYVLYPKAEPSQPPSPPHKTPRSPHKTPPTITSPPPPKLSQYNQKALSILHQDSLVFPITKDPFCSYSQEYEKEFPALTAFEHLDSLAKIKNLKIQLQALEQQHKPKRITSLIDDPWRLPSTPFVGFSFDPQPLPQSYTNITSPSLNIWASKQRKLKPSTRKEPTFSQESQSIADVVASTKTPDVLPIQKVNPISLFLNSLTQTDKPRNPQVIALVIKPQKDYEEFDNVESFEHLFMAEPENAESVSSLMQKIMKNTKKTQTKRLPQNSQKLQYYTIDVVIKRFLTRLQGRLRDWYHSLGEYRQLQIQQSISPKAFMSIIYSEFMGSLWEHTTHAREEFLKMKYDVNLKQDFLNSLLESLRNEVYWALEARNVTIAQTTLGELYQLILNAFAKLCKKKKFLAEFEKTSKRLGIACDDKYLQIKCKDKSSCDCHFARNYLDKKRSLALIQALNQVEPVDVFDLESLYSLDDEPGDSVLCTIAYSDFSSDDDSDSDSLESDSDFGVYMINPIPHVFPIQEDPPLPLVKIHLLTDAYAKPIPVIAFFDTGSNVSILNPNILPDHYWKPHHQNFMAANGEKFIIDKISVPINIRLFPKCVIKRRLLGSSSHGKYLLIGFDILHKLPNLRWTGEDTRSLMARANGDPYKIPYYVLWNISVWSKDHPDAYKWIEANGQWLYDNFVHYDVETSDDDDDARSLWSSNDDEHFDPFEDDPTHPDARWSP